MVLENRPGKMEQSIKGSGVIIKLQEKENLLISKGIVMRDNGKMIKLMVMEYISIKKHKQNMKVFGKTICSMDQVFRLILMEINMRECINKEESMAKEHIILLMGLYMKDNGKTEEFKEKESVLGKMVENMWDNGQQIKDMEKENIHGLMDAHMMENTEMIKDMEKAHTIGVMEEDM